MSRYTVWSVGRDGNVVDHLSFEDAKGALELRRHLSLAFSRPIKVGITDNEDPEAGDVSHRLERWVE